MEQEMISFKIIAYAGEARSYAFNALQSAKKGDFKEAENLINKSKDSMKLAHQVQTDILFKEIEGEKTEMSVLLVHAQDHLMTALLAIELIEEMIELYRNKERSTS